MSNIAPVAPETQLVRVFTGQIGGIPANVCDARELHTYLEVARDFSTWLNERVEKYGFEENRDFAVCSPNPGSKKRGGHNRKDYHLSLDMAKELSMVENNDQGRTARRYFIDMERKALEAAGQIVPASHIETLLPSEQQTLSEIVHKKAQPYGDDIGKALAEIWSRLHHKFRIAKYSQLPRTQLADAIVYITGMTLKLAAPAEEALSSEQWRQLSLAAQRASANWFLSGDATNQWLHNRLRTEFNIRQIADLPPSKLPEALAILKDIEAKASVLCTIAIGLRDAFHRDIIGAGDPWTPWVARQLGGAHMVPERPDWKALGRALLQQKQLNQA